MENYYQNKFSYYSRIAMMIILSIEFILNIVFLSIVREVNAQTSEKIISDHQKCISAIFSLFFISYFVFILELIAYCGCCMKTDCHELFNIIFKQLNHLIILASFLICQFLYFTQSMIIPVYLDGVNFLFYDEKKIKNIKNKYKAMTAICIIFLVLIIFLNFIVINLYKGICCKMERICQNTQNCIENFGRWFIDKLSWVCCLDSKETMINRLENVKNQKDVKIYDLTGDIRNLLAENVALSLKDYN